MDQADEGRDAALEAFLATDPGAHVAALDERGFMGEPDPAFDVFDRFTHIPLMGPRRTFMEAVRPADRRIVLDVWFRANKEKTAVGPVHLVNDPERQLSFMIISMHHRGFGWLAVLADVDLDATVSDAPESLRAFTQGWIPRTATMTKNLYGIITAVDERACLMTGWREEDLTGKSSVDMMHPDDRDRAIAAWLGMLSDGSDGRVRFRQLCSDGSWMWVEAENEFQDNPDQAFIIVTSHLSDISDEMAAHEALERQERQLRILTESLPSGLIQVDRAGSVLYANVRAGQLLRPVATDSLEDYLQLLTAADRSRLLATVELVIADHVHRELEIPIGAETEAPSWCIISIAALDVEAEDTAGAVLSLLDITETVRLREALTVQATIDPLTSCHNRASTLATLDRALSARNPLMTMVVFIDLDKFKPINDQLGHAVGDAYLAEAARRLSGAVRANDIVGRIGGDEFLIVCQQITHQDEVTALTLRIKRNLEAEAIIAGSRLRMRASIGVAVADGGIGAEELVALADSAMYESKRSANGTPVQIRHGEMHQLIA